MDISEVLQRAQAFQERMTKVQEEMGKHILSATVGGGMVTATVNGRHELLAVQISPEAIDPADPEMLQDLVVAAVNEALRRSKELVQVEMDKMTGGLRIPGLF